MVAPPPSAALTAELRSAEASGLVEICARAERAAGLPACLLLAIASRETGCRDVVGDHGHGRGYFQIDDRYHHGWLARHRAGGAGMTPPPAAAAAYAAGIVESNLAYGRVHGVRNAELMRFALSAYNAGPLGALRGYRAGDSDLETTGHDYGADVLARMEAFRRARRPLLSPGARGPAIAELTALLRAWYEREGTPVPRFTPGPVLGPATVRALLEFQVAVGLEPDGIAGPLTWAALADAPS